MLELINSVADALLDNYTLNFALTSRPNVLPLILIVIKIIFIMIFIVLFFIIVVLGRIVIVVSALLVSQVIRSRCSNPV